MASSRRLTVDSTKYTKLEDLDQKQASQVSTHSTDIRHTSRPEPLSLSSRQTPVRRRRELPRLQPIKAMSLVGLKNLFFRQTVVPVPVRTPKRPNATFAGPYDWSSTSTQPLLDSRSDAANLDADSDVESQSVDSKTEKARKKSGFRIDARVISDATIGLSDGLTVPFALTAGLSALGNTKVVIYGGFAELIAGAISMGLGGYLGAKSEAASYKATRNETEQLIATNPSAVLAEIEEVFEPYNLPKSTLEDLTSHLAVSPKLVDFVMQFQHCEEEPAASRALTSALTIAAAYFVGGLLPLVPYFCVSSDQVWEGLYISIGVMVIALFVFGYVKTCVVVGWNGGRNIREGCFGGIQMVVVGSAAAGAAMGLVRLFNDGEGSV
ncbi:hypothetical protein BP6252_10047 [Coleophoma cylindrospora]|uniref:DUF125-domain-containing protein n=1 Tax=Coleophoma cylindrospora TaxID=1849047 RepID=A0A3D8QX90_9HELO|nr:hypothetical protein BP6252_10047 [Coleophoma cylindrospora]